jgi:hypothetical protein
MSQYIVELPHQPGECLDSMDEVKSKGTEALSKVTWGCGKGTHKGWATVEADSPEDARDMIAGAMLMPKAQITEVEVYTPEKIERMHAA